MTRLRTPGAMIVTSLFILSACAPNPCSVSFSSDRLEAAGQTLDCLLTLDATTTAQMPTSGTAAYSGYLTAQLGPDGAVVDSLFGDAALVADFGAAQTVTGTMSNLTSDNEGALGGTLSLANGSITGTTFTGDINGNLTGYGTQSITIASTGGGLFLGSGAQGLLAGTTGTVSYSGGGADDVADILIYGLQ
ncbi:MAG: hypothetical protein ACC619_02925 [Paracoccaceae bacterium]